MSFAHNTLTQELMASFETGILSQGAIDIVEPIAREKFLWQVVQEWKASPEQEEAIHESGMDRFKKYWNNERLNMNTCNPGYIAFTLYRQGLQVYIMKHKRLI